MQLENCTVLCQWRDKFTVSTKEKQLVSKIVAPSLFGLTNNENVSEAQVTEFREAFAMFDKDGDGSISVAELGELQDD